MGIILLARALRDRHAKASRCDRPDFEGFILCFRENLLSSCNEEQFPCEPPHGERRHELPILGVPDPKPSVRLGPGGTRPGNLLSQKQPPVGTRQDISGYWIGSQGVQNARLRQIEDFSRLARWSDRHGPSSPDESCIASRLAYIVRSGTKEWKTSERVPPLQDSTFAPRGNHTPSVRGKYHGRHSLIGMLGKGSHQFAAHRIPEPYVSFPAPGRYHGFIRAECGAHNIL